MESLKDKIKIYTEADYYEGLTFDVKAIPLEEFEKAIVLFEDARDHPEKYPEICREFTGYPNGLPESEHKTYCEGFVKIHQIEWRDFLFRKIIEGE